MIHRYHKIIVQRTSGPLGLFSIISPKPDTLPSHIITVSEFYLAYYQDVVQVLYLSPTILNLSMNVFVHPYLAFYVIFISLKNPLGQLLPY